MKKTLMAAGAVVATATVATAGGIERSSNDYGLLFQDGDQANVSVTLVNPQVSGKYPASLGGGSTGNMAKNYTSISAGYKKDIGDRLSFGLFVNDAYGADADYREGVYAGLTATWDSEQVAFILKYDVSDRFSVYGGARYVQSTAEITIPEALVGRAVGNHAMDLGNQATNLGRQAAVAAASGDLETAAKLGAQARELGTEARTLGTALATTPPAVGGTNWAYSAQSNRDGQFGYVLGAAYQIPDIALRVGLTWESEIEHSFDTHEVIPALGVDLDDTTKITLPQSVKLDFQSGVAKNTLVFGSIKWTEWSKWEVRTPGYEAVTGTEVTGLDDDTITWRVGVGHKFNEKASGFAQVRYEKSNGGDISRLSPTDGLMSFGIGGQLVDGNVKLRGGIEYVSLGNAEDASGVKFEDNSAIGMGLSLTVSF